MNIYTFNPLYWTLWDEWSLRHLPPVFRHIDVEGKHFGFIQQIIIQVFRGQNQIKLTSETISEEKGFYQLSSWHTHFFPSSLRSQLCVNVLGPYTKCGSKVSYLSKDNYHKIPKISDGSSSNYTILSVNRRRKTRGIKRGWNWGCSKGGNGLLPLS